MNDWMRRAAAGLLAALLLAGCGTQDRSGAEGRDGTEAAVLARVNGEAITERDVDRALTRMTGGDSDSLTEKSVRRRALQSLVLSRVIAQAAEDELDADARREIDERVEAYREQLLVKRYLRRHAAPEPVGEQELREYYQQNPERFGGGTRTRYQLVTVTRELRGDERDRVIGELGDAGSRQDWHAWAADQREAGLPLTVRQGVLEDAPLPSELSEAIGELAEGETSDVVLVDGRPYRARVTGIDRNEPRPLAEVRGQIRQSLLPRRVRSAIDEVSGPLMERAEIEYPDPRYRPESKRGETQGAGGQ